MSAGLQRNYITHEWRRDMIFNKAYLLGNMEKLKRNKLKTWLNAFNYQLNFLLL